MSDIPMPETPTKAVAPNPKDAEFMFRVVQNMEGNPKINWDNVARDMGLKNASVASVRFGQIKKKLGFNMSSPAKNADSSPGSGTKTTSSKVSKARAKPGAKKVPKNAATDKKEEINMDDHESYKAEVEPSVYDSNFLTKEEEYDNEEA